MDKVFYKFAQSYMEKSSSTQNEAVLLGLGTLFQNSYSPC